MNRISDVLIGGLQKHQSIKTDGICTCLTAAMGEGGGYIPMVVTYEIEETIHIPDARPES